MDSGTARGRARTVHTAFRGESRALPCAPRLTQSVWQPTTYKTTSLDSSRIRSYDGIVNNTQADASDAATELVLDARSNERFTGEAPEPRPGLSSGHMPNSVSLPFTDLLSSPSSTNPSYKTLKSPDELRKVLLKAVGSEQALQDVLSGKKRVVNSCGSGMTAAVIWLALQELGVDSAIYDEVGQRHLQRLAWLSA